MDILEKEIESYFVRRCASAGALAWKFVSPGRSGVPDRIVIIPGGRVVFVELKAPRKKPRPLQKVTIAELREAGCKVYVIDSKEKVQEFIESEVRTDGVRSAPVSGGRDRENRGS